MSFNLIDRVKENITDEVTNLVGRAIHVSDGQTDVAINSTLSGLLYNLLKITSSKLGTEALFHAIRDQDDTILDNLTDELIGDNHKALANTGSFSLNSLLGIRGIKHLTHTVSLVSSLSYKSASSLPGILLPILLAVMKRKLVNDEKLNSQGVVSLLKGQKDLIEEQLPSVFFEKEEPVKEVERLAPVIDEPMKDEKPKSKIESLTLYPEEEPVKEPVTYPGEPPSLLKKFLPLFFLPLLLLPIVLFFGYQFVAKKADAPMSLPGEQVASGVATNRLAKDEIDAIKELSSILDKTAELLNEVSNAKTAKVQVPKLEQQAVLIEKLGKRMQAMSPAAKEQAATLVRTKLPKLQHILDRINKAPGGFSTLEPVIDKIILQLVDTFM